MVRDHLRSLGRVVEKLLLAPRERVPFCGRPKRAVSFFFQTAARLVRCFGKELKTADFGSRLGKLHYPQGSGDN